MSADSSTNSFKVVVVGSSGVGKTAVVRQLIDGKFNEEGQPTIGVEFKTYSLTADGDNIKLQIWDTAGQERFRSVSKAYFRNAVGAILVYDITNRASFEELNTWLNDLNSLAAPNACIVLIGNKSDLTDERQIDEAEADAFAQRYGLTRLETSAKDGTGVKEAFARLGEGIIRKEKEGKLVTPKPASESGAINTNTVTKTNKGGCC